MRYPISRSPTLAVVFGNRDFFPDHLVIEARSGFARLFKQLGIKVEVYIHKT